MAPKNEVARHPQKLLEHLRYHVLVIDVEGRILYSNAVSRPMRGYSAEESIGMSMQDFVHPDDFAQAQAFIAEVAAEPDATRIIELRSRHKDGRYIWIEVTATNKLQDPDLAGIVVNDRDISERKAFEAETNRLNRILSVLSGTNQAIVRIRDQQALFEQICHIAVEQGGFLTAWIGLKRPDMESVRLVAQTGLSPVDQAGLEESLGQVDGSTYKVYSSLVGGAHIVNNDLELEPQVSQRYTWMRFGARAIGAFPLMVNGVFRGVLTLNSAEADVFTDTEIKLLDEMALDLAFALEFRAQEAARQQAEGEVERYARRMEILHQIDQGIIAADSTEVLVESVLRNLHKLVPCERASVAILDRHWEKMTLFALDLGMKTALKPGVPVPHAPNWVEEFGAAGQILIGDMTLLETPNPWQRSLMGEGLRAAFHVLLTSQGQAFGALNLSSVTPNFFSREYQEIAREIGAQLAIAIQQKYLHETLHQREIQYRQVVEDQVDLICRYRPDFTITFVNQAYANLLGKRADEIVGTNLLTLLPDDQRDYLHVHLASISSSQPLVTAENPIIAADGSTHWLQFHDRAILDSEGRVVEIQAVGRDITERKLAEEAEHEQRQIAEALRDSLAALSSSLDVDEVLRLILDYAAIVVPTEGGSIILFEGDTERIARLRGFQAEVDERFTGYRFPLSSPKYRRIVTERQPVVLADTAVAPEWISFPETNWIRSTVAIPIEVRGEVIGVLNADSAVINRFTAKDVDHLQAFALYAALALGNAYDAAQLEQRVKERTAELNDAKERVEAILNSSLDGILLAGPDLRIQRTNPSFDSLFNCVGNICIGKPILDLIHPDDQARVRNIIQAAFSGRADQQIETCVCRIDGTTFDAELGISTIDAGEREVDGIVCTVRDISERKRAQESLAEERNLLRTLIDALPDLVWIKDVNHHFILHNTARDLALRDLIPEDAVGKDDFERWPEEMAAIFRAREDAILRTGTPLVDDEALLTDRNGQPVWVLTSKIPMRNLNGENIGLIGFARNITERKQREQELRFHASLQENVTDAVISTDLTYHIQSWNKAAERIYGWSAEEVFGKTVREILGTEFDSDEQAKQMQNDLFQDGRWQGEVIQHRRDGSKLYMLGSVALFRDADGALLGIVAVNHDITKRKQTEQALNAKLEQEREFQQYLKELHEIAIELTPIDHLDDFYRSVVELGRSRLGFERLALFLYDAQHGTAIGTYGTDENGMLSDERDLKFVPSPNGLMLRAFQREERFAFEGDVPLLTNMQATGRGWNASSILWDGSKSQGWLVVDNGLHHKPASQAQLDILALYSLSVGTLLARKKTEAALRQSEASLQAVMNSTSVGILLIDRNGTILLANQLAREYGTLLYNQTVELRKSSLFDLELNDRPGVEHLLERVFAGEHMHVELTQRGRAREYVIDLHYDPVTTASGEVIGATVSFIDVTERRQAELALEKSAAEIHDLYNNAPCGYHSLDANGLIVQINDTELAWLGYSREEIVGKRSFYEFLTPESKVLFESTFPTFKAQGWIKDLEFDAIRKDGSSLSVLVSASAIVDSSGQYLMSRTTVFDVTERKHAEAALRESEEKFRSLVEGAPEAIVIVDHDGRITLVNAETEKIFGYRRNELVGQMIETLVPNSERDPHRSRRASYTANPRMRSRGSVIGIQGQRKDGSTFDADVQLSYIETQDGVLVMAFIADITERKQAEEAIRASEARYRLLADNISDMIARVDAVGNIEYVSPSSRSVLGYEPDELIGTSGFALVHPDDLTAVVNAQLATLNTEIVTEGPTFRYRHKDGHYVWVETSGRLIWAEETGELVGYVFVARDVTERRTAQEALKQSEELLRKVLDSLPVGVWLVSTDGRITLSNPASEKIWAGARYRRSEADGVTNWWPEPGMAIMTDGAADRAIRAGETSLDEPLEIEAFDGSPKHLLNSAIPIRDRDDHIVGAIIVNQDITVMKLAENTLRKSFEQEKELGDLKSRLVSMASHEFRTPLATILSSSEMLLNYRERMDAEKINRKLVTIANQVKHLTNIVEDVLDLTRMQTGKTEFKPIQADLDALCHEILDEFRNRPEITQTITYDCANAPVLLPIDKKLVRQIIINLVSNATKYSPPQTAVTINLEADERNVVLRVSDAGIGIPEADLRHLFEPFHRAGNVGTISGTGLGLSITKQAIELHGGTIKVESVVNLGTTFSVILPLRGREPVSEQPDEADRML